MGRLKAIIWVPAEDRQRWEALCLAYCSRKDYQVVSLVIGGQEKWADIWRALTSGAADVCVVHSKSEIQERRPRLEAVTEELPRIPEQRARRTRLIRRDEGA